MAAIPSTSAHLARKQCPDEPFSAGYGRNGRRLGVLLPPDTAAKLRRIETDTRQSARQVIIGLIDSARTGGDKTSDIVA